LINQRAFFYTFRGDPGMGILAENTDDKWKRVNYFAFGINADELQKSLRQFHDDSEEGTSSFSAIPAQSKSVLAGGIVLKGITCLIKPEAEHIDVLQKMEKGIEGLSVPDPADMKRVESFNPMESYWSMYKGILPGLTRVIFFEYATQFAIMGMSRERDLHVVEELYADMEGLRDYTTIPKPLRNDEYDARSDIYLYIIRNPLKEELQGDYVKKLLEIEGLAVYSL
jgi:hypothetical protein